MRNNFALNKSPLISHKNQSIFLKILAKQSKLIAEAHRIEYLVWVDSVKGFASCLVVLGHAVYSEPIHNFIYLFHMPLFFIMSGMLFRVCNPRDLLRRQLHYYLPTYIFYLLVVGIPYEIYILVAQVEIKKFSIQYFYIVLENLLYGGARLKGAMAAFWFLPCLLISQQIFNFITLKLKNLIGRILMILLISVIGFILNTSLGDPFNPINIWVSLIVVIFIWFGSCIFEIIKVDLFNKKQFVIFNVLTIISVNYFIFAWNNPELVRVDVKFGLLGPPFIGVLAAFIISCWFILVVRYLCYFSWLTMLTAALGRASLVIMFVHGPILYMASMINGRYPNSISPFFATLVALIISWVLFFMVSKNLILSRLLASKIIKPM